MNLNLVGRLVSRVMFHNGIHIGSTAAHPGKVTKCLFAAGDERFAKSSGDKCKVMAITPAGVYLEFADSAEKLIPFSNIYESDLFPEVAPEKADTAEKATKAWAKL